MSTVGPHELPRKLPPVDFVTEDRVTAGPAAEEQGDKRTEFRVDPGPVVWRPEYRKLTRHERSSYGYDEGYLRRAAKWLIERMFSKTDQGRHDESLALKEAARLKAVWLEAEGMCEANCWYDLALRRYREQARAHRLRSYRPSMSNWPRATASV